ncbi:MAG TPA: hypothetical protein VGM69_03705 [Chloroflexota bacterium]|jgi:hypothetical protein
MSAPALRPLRLVVLLAAFGLAGCRPDASAPTAIPAVPFATPLEPATAAPTEMAAPLRPSPASPTTPSAAAAATPREVGPTAPATPTGRPSPSTLPGPTALATPAATLGPGPSASPTPAAAAPASPATGAAAADPAAELERALASPPPARDVVDLWRRYRTHGEAVPTVRAEPIEASVGALESFWISDSQRRRYFQARARLVARSAHFDMWVQEGERADEASLGRSLDRLETRTLPSVLREFGGGKIREDRLRVAIVNVRVGGIIGYYSSVNEYPRAVAPFSNERPLVVMSLGSVQPGSGGYDSGLAHELQHLVQWRLDPAEDTWVNEGTAELAVRAVGLDAGGNVQAFLQRPETQLNHWAEQIGETPPHYGAAHLFFAYLAQRRGGYSFVGEVLARPEAGIRGVEAALRSHGGDGDSASFDRLFLDWVVANWANAPSAAAGRWGYLDQPTLRAREERLDAVPTRVAATVNQYGARYYPLPAAAAGEVLTLEARPEVKLVGAPDRPGTFWWSGRGDSRDSRLTRDLDLTGVAQARLRFATWYDLERDFDYGFVSVSEDAGKSWSTLPGRNTTTSDPNGANLGHGLTGKSNGWVDEEIDLSAYAGRRVSLRFEMVTDDAYNGGGWCIGGVAVPEIGFREEPSGNGWRAEGFMRIANRVPQRLTGQLITIAGDDVRVDPLVTGPDGRARTRVPARPPGARQALAVAAHTPLTIESAPFELALEP